MKLLGGLSFSLTHMPKLWRYALLGFYVRLAVPLDF